MRVATAPFHRVQRAARDAKRPFGTEAPVLRRSGTGDPPAARQWRKRHGRVRRATEGPHVHRRRVEPRASLPRRGQPRPCRGNEPSYGGPHIARAEDTPGNARRFARIRASLPPDVEARPAKTGLETVRVKRLRRCFIELYITCVTPGTRIFVVPAKVGTQWRIRAKDAGFPLARERRSSANCHGVP